MRKPKIGDARHSDVIKHAITVAKLITKRKEHLIDILTDIESLIVAEDEVNRVLDLLRSLRENKEYFVNSKVSKIASFLPLNLPFYSLFLFAIIPSYQSKEVVVRAPKLLHTTLNKLANAFSMDKLFPNVHTKDVDRDVFVQDECKTSDVVIFTGKYNNFLKIKDQLSKKTLFLYNGVGHNPVVVTPNADILLAAEKVAFLKTFNNGQDCAGADMVLVHKDVIDIFIDELKKCLGKVKTGSTYKNGVVIGPLAEPSSLFSTAEMLGNVQINKGRIVYGGKLDFKNNVVIPTICQYHIKNFRNYQELYSPVILVSEYDSDDDLSSYFDDPERRYVQEQMYVSVFGASNYVTNKVLGTIVLKDLIIHDVERGTEEYGGYSYGASLVSKSGISICKPVLVPREIYNYLLRPVDDYTNITLKMPLNKIIQNLVSNNFVQTVQRIFNSNLEFAFIFGSFARGRGKNFSDIDTFICVKKIDQKQVSKYIDWIFSVTEIYGKIPDFIYPAEIMTLEELGDSLNMLPAISLSSDQNSSKVYDSVLWAHALSHAKLAIVHPENIPEHWTNLFQENSKGLITSFLSNRNMDEFNQELYEKLGNNNIFTEKEILDVLKVVPFEVENRYSKHVVHSLSKRNFFGRKIFFENNKLVQPSKAFRFGPA